ncbi:MULTISPECIES: SpoVR family protein [Clostridium]|uniref:Stage V sporulation protein R n=1 Tax=Clostridium botulinum (strain Eklund 17B / Type B) TaxID=935198 RepID=B2TPZ9_CLOBB|nr:MULTISPECIES: SpoVR family protein [Clostridium]ACD23836.1 stage V sporulation protein R [Clostridium botulinum B str. Eklund 17B (NRP)]MBN1039672.1 stage V sporulation protein R [Clostridium botulinum]MBN1046514.1 stage V sporulation protein R [Clostridium botulinum]MBN1053218.1 stage V sporulation protein R [Clostridium botulinum]MBN1056414.1 stage V sporulation protein R [Clostridium botulinum]
MSYTLREIEEWNDKIEKKVIEYGLDFYNQEFEFIDFNEMLGYESYVGMPSKYPHWSYGKAYEKNKMLYSLNLTGLPYEMVINSDPCLAYLMKENTLLLQILTMAHVYGHNDFFKNNRLFKEGTNAKYAIEMFKLDADIIRRYINNPSIGYEKVERILDAAHAIRYQIGRVIGVKKLSHEEIKQSMIKDYESKLDNRGILNQDEKIEFPDLDKIPIEPEDDVVDFIIKYGDLQEWERTVLKIVKRETEYFLPQMETKIMNEGWASYTHYNILKELNLPDGLHFEFLKRHNDVIAPIVGGLNPYYVGFKIFEDLDKKYGKEKIFEVREIERDSSFLRRYLTRELCEELNLFEYNKRTFDIVVEEVSDEEGWKEIRDNLSYTCGIGGIPYIRVIDLNTKDYTLTLEHVFDGRELELNYAKETLKYIQELWGKKVRLITKDSDKKDVVITCNMDKEITIG